MVKQKKSFKEVVEEGQGAGRRNIVVAIETGVELQGSCCGAAGEGSVGRYCMEAVEAGAHWCGRLRVSVKVRVTVEMEESVLCTG